jgi:hypothetical protein
MIEYWSVWQIRDETVRPWPSDFALWRVKVIGGFQVDVMKLGKGNLSSRHKVMLAMLFVGPFLVAVGKWPALPASEFFMRAFSLASLSGNRESRVEYILSVPFGATLVVFFRLFLGIRLLGPFRSILIAVAFQITGILPGLVFLAIVIGIVLATRPFIKAIRLPYFARVSVIVSIVALIMLMALLSSTWLGIESLSRVAYFPIIALCLMGEGFARTLSKEGLGSALWRGTMTAFVAVLITFLFQINGFRKVFLYFPELLIIEIGCIIVVGEFLDFRLLAWLNPPVPSLLPSMGVMKKAKSRAKKAARL